MPRLTSSAFMRALPDLVRSHLPPAHRKFKTTVWGWLCQIYYRDPRLHYEIWNMGEQRGKLELGLHFESRDRALNAALLAGFSQHMAEIKATLGPQWEAEPWDKGWTKVYEVVPYEPFTSELLASLSARLARAITVLQPIWDSL